MVTESNVKHAVNPWAGLLPICDVFKRLSGALLSIARILPLLTRTYYAYATHSARRCVIAAH
jgi:hypothetical protein